MRRHDRHVASTRIQHAHRRWTHLHDTDSLGLRQIQRRSALARGCAGPHDKAIVLLFFLASVSGGIPLLIYFQGLHLTRASTAGYFEMMQTLAAVCITWGFFHASLHPHQVIAAMVLIAAVAMVHHVQQQIEPAGNPR